MLQFLLTFLQNRPLRVLLFSSTFKNGLAILFLANSFKRPNGNPASSRILGTLVSNDPVHQLLISSLIKLPLPPTYF